MKSFKDGQLPEKQRKIFGLIVIIFALIFVGVISYFIGKPMIKFVSNPEQFRLWIDSHGFLGKIAFVGMVIFQVFIAIIPGEPLEIGAGYAFGAVEGSILCIIGCVLGGILVFAFVRTFGIKFVSVFFSMEKINSIKFLQNTRQLKTIAFIVFFLPGTPKDLLSYGAGLTKIEWSYWLFLTSVARIPSIVTSTVGGDAIGLQEYKIAILVFGATLALSVAGMLIYNRIIKRNNKEE